MVGGGWVSSDGEGVVNFPIFEGKGGGEGRAVELEVEVEKVSGREMASPCFPGLAPFAKLGRTCASTRGWCGRSLKHKDAIGISFFLSFFPFFSPTLTSLFFFPFIAFFAWLRRSPASALAFLGDGGGPGLLLLVGAKTIWARIGALGVSPVKRERG